MAVEADDLDGSWTWEGGHVEIILALHGTNSKNDLESFFGWISEAPGLAVTRGARDTAAPDGAMGGMADVIAAAVGSGGTLTVLAHYVKVWIQQQKAQRGVDVRVEISTMQGMHVIINVHNANNAESIIRKALEGGSSAKG